MLACNTDPRPTSIAWPAHYLITGASWVASSIYQNYINSVSNILKIIGVNINTVPVADLFFNKAHKIIGDRSFSSKVLDIQTLSSNCVSAYKKNKIATVIKHIPGHGRAKVDSHKRLPTVVTSYKTLINEEHFE